MPNLQAMTTDAQRRRRLMLTAAGLVAAVAIVAVLIASGGSSGSNDKTASPAAKAAAASGVSAEFKGIPQNGNVLGDPNAPATLMVFADLQCPFCAEWETGALPQIVKRYVRPGKLQVVFQPVAILGEDSVTGARWVSAAAGQNKMFQFAALFYRNQGQENSGYVNDAFLAKLARQTPGLDVAKAAADAKSKASIPLLERARVAANAAKVDSTPTFMIGANGGTLQKLEVSSLAPEAFTGDLDKLTSR
jgi:protein-disulfide isomerase